ncbi:capsule assembly Wzi family protein [Mucilaginibacter aquaedulcis]|uniref:capsule assembly Wzi family protein n=1 Tax=Mucilaginibacter aquaedulcis TaxID=1187081 RepID=UPI0025B4FB23|nr:capsule assembly Wzi family protein [Mucilaginibacter aquaedulcis]MDN3547628.1 capsule assembly Wzi family protein [Mucilaginibacter aquaedulcis]
MRRIFFAIYLVCSIAVILLPGKTNAQSVPVGTPVLDDYYRRMQLVGKVDSNLSFTARPIFPGYKSQIHDVYDPDSTLKRDHWVSTGPISFGNGHGVFQVLPLTWQQQFNSNHPYGWNDGAMIPAKGYQTMVSGGFFFKYGPLSIQFRPEFVYAANLPFESFAKGHTDQDLYNFYIFANQIDMPEHFGNGAYSKAFWGQSSVRLTFGPVSFGLSNENLWWGPGIRNSLILSNNAPGFKHLTLNTVKPINTYIGSFEGQVIAGRLDASGFLPMDVTTQSDGTNLLVPKTKDWRYFTGFNINYHPKWIQGFTLGLTRTFNAYHEDVKGFSGYIPFFVPYQKVNTNDGDPFPRDQYTSLYARWLFTKAQAEVYFEYGLNDNSYNIRDFIGSPDHARAYIFGFRKMLPFNGSNDQHILFSGEVTQLSQTPDRLVRQAYGWYIHGGVSDGHTNLGQILGAGTGTGGNLQSIDVSWVSGLKKLGFGIERYEHNVDLYEVAFPDINGNSRKWVDFAFALNGEWSYKNLVFNAKIQEIKSLNYNWVLKDYVPDQYYIPHNNVYNLHAELGVTFRF